MSKTRPTTTKVRVEINLAKPLVEEILLEIINDEGIKEIIVQKIDMKASLPSAHIAKCKVILIFLVESCIQNRKKE